MEGKFIVENIYNWFFVIDGIYVIDENSNKIFFDEIQYLWFFQKG